MLKPKLHARYQAFLKIHGEQTYSGQYQAFIFSQLKSFSISKGIDFSRSPMFDADQIEFTQFIEGYATYLTNQPTEINHENSTKTI